MADLIGLDQLCGCDLDAVQTSFERLFPEIQKLRQDGKFRSDIEVLPDIGLEEAGMVREVVEELRALTSDSV